MGTDYPSPDPKFHDQAIALMKQKQDQLNREYQEQEANEAKVEKPIEEPVTEPKKVTKKSTPTPKDVDEDLSAIVADWDD